MRQRYYTPEQLDQLEQRRQTLGEEAIRDVEREWAEIFATLRAEMDAGTDPADPKLRPLAERGQELVAMFTGGDPGITSSLKQMWENEDPEKVSHGMVDAEVWAYYGEVQAAAASFPPSGSSSQAPVERSAAGSCRRCSPRATR